MKYKLSNATTEHFGTPDDIGRTRKEMARRKIKITPEEEDILRRFTNREDLTEEERRILGSLCRRNYGLPEARE